MAVLVIAPRKSAGGRTVRLIGGNEAPGASVPVRVQVTTPAAWVQLQPVPVADTYTRGSGDSVGSVSTTVNGPTAVSAPLFRTTMDHV